MSFAAVFGEAILGWLIADFLSAIFHWWQQRVGEEHWPIIGRWIIKPARMHHDEPLAFTENGFWYRSGTNLLAAALVGLVWWWIAGASVILATAMLGGALANEIHLWTHRPTTVGPIIRVLQEIGLLQSAKGHSRHHRPPQNTHYCPITDWLNPVLEALDVWRRLEKLLKIPA